MRRALPVVLTLIGVCLVVYGAAFHAEDVIIEREVRITDPAAEEGGFFFGEEPPPGLPPIIEEMILEQGEPRLVREVTYGGLALLDSGELKRTYRGKPPSLCPT